MVDMIADRDGMRWDGLTLKTGRQGLSLIRNQRRSVRKQL